jgi:hypothetical protein
MAVSTRPISARAISGDTEEATTQQGKFRRQFRTPVVQDRYPGLDAVTMSEPGPVEAKTPLYDALPPESRAKIDRLIVGVRMATMRGAT